MLAHIPASLFLLIVFAACQSPMVTTDEFEEAMGYDVTRAPSYWCPLPPTVDQVRENLYKIELIDFDAVEAEMARQDYCWAACVQMIRRFNGDDDADQEEIVHEVKGELGEFDNGTASALEIVGALSGPWKYTSVSNGIPNQLALDLANNRPVLVGLLENEDDEYGHTYVLVGADIAWYGPVMGSQAIFDRVKLYDPRPGAGYERMSADEFKEKLSFAVHCQ